MTGIRWARTGIELNKSLKLVVTGIAKDVPANSTLNFTVILPLAYMEPICLLICRYG